MFKCIRSKSMSDIKLFATRVCSDLLRPNVTWKMINLKYQINEEET
jgi:hypothetical protein